MKNAKTIKIDGVPINNIEVPMLSFSSKLSQISVVIVFDITEFPSRLQFSLNDPIKSMMMDILFPLLFKCTLYKHSELI